MMDGKWIYLVLKDIRGMISKSVLSIKDLISKSVLSKSPDE